jgi:VanZ family protein
MRDPHHRRRPSLHRPTPAPGIAHFFWLALAALLVAPLFLASEEVGKESPVTGPYWDKVVHAGYYGLITIALDHGLARRTVFPALLAAIAIGAADELHQRDVPGRTADPLDWLADIVGACVAAFWRHTSRRRRRRSG